MNKNEQVEILNELKAMFPDWERWVKDLPNYNATLRVWCRSLESVEKQHVVAILDEYLTGRRKVPTSYEYERLIFSIAAYARQLQSVEYAKDQNRETLAECVSAQEIRKRRKSYKSFQDRNMNIAGAKFAALVEAIGKPRSQWTEDDLQQYREQCDQVVKEFIEAEKRY